MSEYTGMNFPYNYEELPLKDAIDRYVQTGHPVGDFLHAILTNELYAASSRADGNNITMIPVYCRYLYNECPTGCYGSDDAYRAWCARGGLENTDE